MKLIDNRIYRADLLRVADKFDWQELFGKTVYITGATGLICSTVIDLMLLLNVYHNAGIRIIAAGRNESKVKSRFGDAVEFSPYDAIESVFTGQVDYIVHGAGNASPELYVSSPVETMLANINGIVAFLNYGRTHQSSRIVYISSSEVYGKRDGNNPFCEQDYGEIDLDSIRNSYAESKRASEMLCKAYSSEYSVYVTIVRPGHVFGPSASAEDKRIASDFAFKAAKGMDLKMLSSGLQNRSYCYSVDCAVAILISLLHGDAGEAYNIGADQEMSIFAMASIIAEAGRVSLTRTEPTKEELAIFNPMNNSTLDDKKIKTIGFSHSFTVREGLQHTVQILKTCLKTL